MKYPILSTRSNYPLNTRDIIPSDIELPKQPFDQQLVEDYILDEEQQAPRYFDQNRPFMDAAPTYWESQQNEDAQKRINILVNNQRIYTDQYESDRKRADTHFLRLFGQQGEIFTPSEIKQKNVTAQMDDFEPTWDAQNKGEYPEHYKGLYRHYNNMKLLNYYNIPIVENEEAGGQLFGLKEGDLYAVAPRTLNETYKILARKEGADELPKTINSLVNAISKVGRGIEKEGWRTAAGAATGISGLPSLIHEIYTMADMFTPYSRSWPDKDVGKGHGYMNLALGVLKYILPDEWGGDKGDYLRSAGDAFMKIAEKRLAEPGYNPDPQNFRVVFVEQERDAKRTLQSVLDNFRKNEEEREEAIKKSHNGIEYQRKWNGRIAKMLAEEIPTVRAMMLFRMLQARKLAKAYGAKYTPTGEVKEGLRSWDAENIIGQPNVAPRWWQVRGGEEIVRTKKEAERLFRLKDIDIHEQLKLEDRNSLAFVAVFDYLADKDPTGEYNGDLTNMGGALLGSFAATFAVDPLATVSKRGGHWLTSLLYRFSDWRAGRKGRLDEDKNIIEAYLIDSKALDSKGNPVKADSLELAEMVTKERIARIEETERRTYKNKELYLIANGFTRHEIDMLYKDPSGNGKALIDNLVAEYYQLNNGKHIDEIATFVRALPDKEKKEFEDMAHNSFEALSTIAETGKEFGLDVTVFIQDIISLRSVQQAAAQVTQEPSGLFSGTLKKQIFKLDRNLERLAANQENLQQSVALHLKKILDFDTSDLDKATLDVLEWWTKKGEEVLDSQHTSIDEMYNTAILKNANKEAGDRFVNQINALRRIDQENNKLADNVMNTFRLQLMITGEIGNVRVAGRKNTDTDLITEIQNNTGIEPKDIKILLKERADKSGNIQASLEDTDFAPAQKLFSTVELNAPNIRFNADTFFNRINEKFIENPDEAKEILDLIHKGTSSRTLVSLQDAIRAKSLDSFIKTAEGFGGEDLLAVMQEVYLRSIRNVDEYNTELNRLTEITDPKEKADTLGDLLRNIDIEDQKNLLPVQLSLKEVRDLDSYFSYMSHQHRGTSSESYYADLRNMLDDMVKEEKSLNDYDTEIVDMLFDAKTLWRESSKFWKRGEFFKVTTKDPVGDKMLPIEQLINSLVEPKEIIRNNTEIRALMRGAPLKVNRKYDENGKRISKEDSVEYKKDRSDQEQELIRKLISKAIVKNTVDGNYGVTELDEILYFYGKKDNAYKTILDKDTTTKISAYRESLHNYMEPMREVDRVHLNDLSNHVKNMKNSIDDAYAKSFLQVLADIASNKGASSNDIVNLFRENKAIRVPELPSNRWKNWFKYVVNAKGERLNYTLPQVTEILKSSPKDIHMKAVDYLSLILDKLPTEDTDILIEHLDKIFSQYLVNNLISKGDAKILIKPRIGKKGQQAPTKNIEISEYVVSQDFLKILEETEDFKTLIWGKSTAGERKITILDKAYKGSKHLLRPVGSKTGFEKLDIPHEWRSNEALSRVYSWQRGVVGLRYLLGEATLKQLRKGESETLRKIFTDPNGAALLTEMLKKNKPTNWFEKLGASLGTKTRILAYVTGLSSTDIALLFTQEDMTAFLEGKPLPTKVLNRAKQLGEARIKLASKRNQRKYKPTGEKKLAAIDLGKDEGIDYRGGDRLRKEAGDLTPKELELLTNVRTFLA